MSLKILNQLQTPPYHFNFIMLLKSSSQAVKLFGTCKSSRPKVTRTFCAYKFYTYYCSLLPPIDFQIANLNQSVPPLAIIFHCSHRTSSNWICMLYIPFWLKIKNYKQTNMCEYFNNQRKPKRMNDHFNYLTLFLITTRIERVFNSYIHTHGKHSFSQ